MRFHNYFSFAALVMVLLALLGGCSSSPSKPQTEAQNPSAAAAVAQAIQPLASAFSDDYRRAQTQLNAGNYTQALALLKKITTANPGYPDAWVNLALAYYGLMQYPAAEQAINRALALENTSGEAFALAGLIQLAQGQYQQAEAKYQLAIKLQPNCASCHYNLALLYDLYYQDLPRAISQYQAYLDHITSTDEDTQAWIEELKRNQARNAGQ